MSRLFWAWLIVTSLLPTAGEAKSPYSQDCGDICADSARADVNLPLDPRALATAKNGYTSTWQECHTGKNSTVPKPATCRQWCAARDHGKQLLETQGLIGSFLDADTYNNLWKAWGLSERPPQAEFERRIVERYGFQPMPAGVSNPYPKPTEDPRTTNGGSGQLPMGLIQTHDADGYDGGIGFTCLLCHGGRIGSEGDGPGLGSRLGIGNTTLDIEVFSYDLGKAGGVPIPLPYPHSEGRGTINAVSDFEFLMIVRDFDTLDQSPFVKTLPAHASPGDQDPPAWHNTGSRPRVYMDGGVSADNTRALMQFLTASINSSGSSSGGTTGSGVWIKNQESDFEDIRAFIDSIEPPAFPNPVDPTSDLYKRGEEIFHTTDLFAPVPAPHGNGSCSSCHGVYSLKPQYVALLPDPGLVGIAGQIVSRDVIQTDPSRVDALSADLRWGWGTLWFAYADNGAKDAFNEVMNDYVSPQTNGLFYDRKQGTCGWIGWDAYENPDAKKLIGYAAPALHGVWATAPYFHNGSVPTVYDVLRFGERPTYWRRPLNAKGSGADRGFDVSLAAYNFEHLGWQYQRLDCDGVPLVECDPDMPPGPPAARAVANLPGSQVWLANQSPRPLTQLDVELRKIYDTTRYGRSNAGHWWTNRDTLSDDDVAALIEYLKTL